MPLGAFRINSLAKTVAAAGSSLSTTIAYSLSNLTFNARSYQIPKISYAGDDSSGQPVFFVGTRNASGNFVCSLIRRNNDDTISESSVTTLKSDDERFEAQGIAGLDTSGNPVGVTVCTYRVGGTTIKTDVYCNQIDLDNLTLGTTYSDLDWTATQSTAGFAYATYTGNGRFAIGYRASGIRVAIATVGTSTISISGEQHHSTNVGDGVYQGIEAFPYQADTDYRYSYHNGNGNQQGVGWFATTTAQGEDSDDIITTGLAHTQTFPVSDSSYITIATKTGTAKATGATVSWPGSGAPTQTVSSEYTFADSATWNGSFTAASDITNNTVYVLHDDTSAGWKIIPLTLSGTTISEGTDIAIESEVTTTAWSVGGEALAACIADSAQGNLFVALIDDTGSSNPQILVRDLS